MNDKKSLRAYYKKLRADMTKDDKASLDMSITEKLLQLDDFVNSKTVLVYVSSAIEVGTYEIIRRCFEMNKRVLAPRCVQGTNIMDFYEIKSFDDLEKGAFGIMEPCDKCEKTELFDTDSCCIVPALAYDMRGYRLGFGKGFYDRFLVRFGGKKVGLCYSSCIEDQLPADEYDQMVNCIVTDKEIIEFNRKDSEF